jgi:hypothetical protein
MLPSAGAWKRKREDLRSRRVPLFEKYKKNPNSLVLAMQIKRIDDEIAECAQAMAQASRQP